MHFFLIYAALAYGFVLLGTLVRFTHFLCKFRLASVRELWRATLFFWSPPLLLSLLTFPLEVYQVWIKKGFIELEYAYEAACAIFNMNYEQLHFAYRIRYYEKRELNQLSQEDF